MKKTVQAFILLAVVAVLTACSSKTNTVKSDEFPAELTRFSPIPENPLFTGTGTDTWDKKIRERGFILFDEGVYKMWYSGYNPDMAREKFLGYATSIDGIHWERYPENPVFCEKWTEDMFVLKHDGTYFMYAEGDNDVAHLMTSGDGIHWQEQGDLTLLTTKGDTVPGPYGTPSVWIEDGQWYLFYERNDMGVWLAKSDDKLTWTNVQDEPVLPLGPDEYDIAAVAANQVVKHNGKYYIYYHATSSMDWQHPTGPVTWTSNVAMSTDLIHWNKYPGNPVVKGDFSSPILVFDGKKPSLYTMHPVVCRYLNN
ncbi:MAG: glycosylase [Bacteroidia bacterium]|nr:glycosylase [Bacteroidia bacterium]